MLSIPLNDIDLQKYVISSKSYPPSQFLPVKFALQVQMISMEFGETEHCFSLPLHGHGLQVPKSVLFDFSL